MFTFIHHALYVRVNVVLVYSVVIVLIVCLYLEHEQFDFYRSEYTVNVNIVARKEMYTDFYVKGNDKDQNVFVMKKENRKQITGLNFEGHGAVELHRLESPSII